MIKLWGHSERPFEVVNSTTGEDFGSFSTKKQVKLAVMLGLIENGDEACLMEYTDKQEEIIKLTASLDASPEERREIFAFVAENEYVVTRLIDAPSASFLIMLSRRYVMELLPRYSRFEAVSSGGAVQKTWTDGLTGKTVSITKRNGA